MPGDQDAFGRIRHLLGRGSLSVEEVNFHQPFLIEKAQGACCGDIDPVIEIEAQHLPLGLHHSDDTVSLACDSHPLPEDRTIRK